MGRIHRERGESVKTCGKHPVRYWFAPRSGQHPVRLERNQRHPLLRGSWLQLKDRTCREVC
uniref:Uncharacterized protein n=1 Tax=Hyaloperonospora arabidopsidis (strain Emoy2) TaxID=559515 RepID=M4B8M3_HYAAE